MKVVSNAATKAYMRTVLLEAHNKHLTAITAFVDDKTQRSYQFHVSY